MRFLGLAVVSWAVMSSAAQAAPPPVPATDGPARPLPLPPPEPTGTVRGTIELKGKAPEREVLRRDSDPVCAAVEKKSDALIVTKGKVAGVLVRIKNGSFGTRFSSPPGTPAVITQQECTYEPRVTGIVARQRVIIKNADETYHNVRATSDGQHVFNLSQAARTPDLVRDDFANVGAVVSLRCDVHPWMNGYVVAQDHPFFAVTGEDGKFELKGVPVGSYELEVWHPVLGASSTKVKVAKNKATAAKVKLVLPKPAPEE